MLHVGDLEHFGNMSIQGCMLNQAKWIHSIDWIGLLQCQIQPFTPKSTLKIRLFEFPQSLTSIWSTTASWSRSLCDPFACAKVNRVQTQQLATGIGSSVTDDHETSVFLEHEPQLTSYRHHYEFNHCMATPHPRNSLSGTASQQPTKPPIPTPSKPHNDPPSSSESAHASTVPSSTTIKPPDASDLNLQPKHHPMYHSSQPKTYQPLLTTCSPWCHQAESKNSSPVSHFFFDQIDVVVFNSKCPNLF